MSLNLILKIEDSVVAIPDTTTNETKHILGGFLETVSSVHNPDKFAKVLENFKDYALSFSEETHKIDNEVVRTVIMIDDKLIESPKSEIVFSFE